MSDVLHDVGRDRQRRLELMKSNARGYADALRATRPIAAADQAHTDQMLTWSVGLMGAGLFALPTVINAACGQNWRFWLGIVAAPWTAGILLALLGRVAAKLFRNADALAFVHRWQAVETALLRDLKLEELGDRLLGIMDDQDPDIKTRAERASTLGRVTDWLFYTTQIAFGIGVVSVFAAIASGC
jgi:hypothetical protein